MTSLVAPDQVSSGRARTRQSRRAGRSQNQQPVRREKKSGQRTSSSKQSKDTPCASRSEHSGRPPTVEPSWAAGSTRKMPLELSRRLRTGERPVALSLGGGVFASLECLPLGEAFAHQEGWQWQLPLPWTTAGPQRSWSRGCFPARTEAGVQLPSHSIVAGRSALHVHRNSVLRWTGDPGQPTQRVHHDNVQGCTGDRVQPLFRCSSQPRAPRTAGHPGFLRTPVRLQGRDDWSPLHERTSASHLVQQQPRPLTSGADGAPPPPTPRHARSFSSCTGRPRTEDTAVHAVSVPRSIIRRPKDVRHYKCPTFDWLLRPCETRRLRTIPRRDGGPTELPHSLDGSTPLGGWMGDRLA